MKAERKTKSKLIVQPPVSFEAMFSTFQTGDIGTLISFFDSNLETKMHGKFLLHLVGKRVRVSVEAIDSQ